jgi:hypothetical protein
VACLARSDEQGGASVHTERTHPSQRPALYARGEGRSARPSKGVCRRKTPPSVVHAWVGQILLNCNVVKR